MPSNPKQLKVLKGVYGEWRNQGCAICGNTDRRVIDAHHRNPDEKSYEIAQLLKGYSVDSLMKELAKCDPLCRNCNFIHHSVELVNLST